MGKTRRMRRFNNQSRGNKHSSFDELSSVVRDYEILPLAYQFNRSLSSIVLSVCKPLVYSCYSVSYDLGGNSYRSTGGLLIVDALSKVSEADKDKYKSFLLAEQFRFLYIKDLIPYGLILVSKGYFTTKILEENKDGVS